MGMYNEVFCECPCCGKLAYTQIGQIVSGFGGFNLGDPDSLMDLSKDQLKDLREAIDDTYFECENCGNYFKYNGEDREEKRKLIRDLFGV